MPKNAAEHLVNVMFRTSHNLYEHQSLSYYKWLKGNNITLHLLIYKNQMRIMKTWPMFKLHNIGRERRTSDGSMYLFHLLVALYKYPMEPAPACIQAKEMTSTQIMQFITEIWMHVLNMCVCQGAVKLYLVRDFKIPPFG